MNKILLPVVEQFLNADKIHYYFLGNNKKIGTIIAEDDEENRCEFYGIPTITDRSQENLKACVTDRLTLWTKQSVTLSIQSIKTVLDESSALLLTKYCALILKQPIPYPVQQTSRGELFCNELRISSTNNSMTMLADSFLLSIETILTDIKDIKGWVMEHSI